MDEGTTERVLRVTLAPRAPIRVWQRTAKLASDKGAIGVGVIGPALPPSRDFVTLNPKVPLLEELGLPRDRDGKHRRFQTQNSNGPTFLARLVSAAGQTLEGSEQRIPLNPQAVSSITAAQLSALPGSALKDRIVLISGEAPWGTAALPTGLGVVPIAEILYRLLSGHPVASFSPWTGLLAFGIGGIIMARLLEPRDRRTFAWALGLAGVSTAAFAVCLALGHAFPIDAVLFLLITSGCFLVATRPVHAESAQAIAPVQSLSTRAFHNTCCVAALQQGSALATWVAVLDGEWKENASAGDAGVLPTESLQRILSPESDPAPEDSAFLVFPFSHSKPGALVIQPGDQADLDLHPIGTAVAQLLGAHTSTARETAPSSQSLGERAWLEKHEGALYDALGRPRLVHASLKSWFLSQDIDPDTNLMNLSEALGWKTDALSQAWSAGQNTLSTSAGERFHLHRLLPPGAHNGLGLEMAEVVPSSTGQAG